MPSDERGNVPQIPRRQLLGGVSLILVDPGINLPKLLGGVLLG